MLFEHYQNQLFLETGGLNEQPLWYLVAMSTASAALAKGQHGNN